MCIRESKFTVRFYFLLNVKEILVPMSLTQSHIYYKRMMLIQFKMKTSREVAYTIQEYNTNLKLAAL